MSINQRPEGQDKIEFTAADVKVLNNGGLQVLYALKSNPVTTEQISIRTGLARAKIQYFVDQFIERKLVEPYRTVYKGNEVEQYYKAVFDDFSFDLSGSESKEEVLSMVQTIISSFQTSLLALFSDTKREEESSTPLFLVHNQSRMSIDRAQIFMNEFSKLTHQFTDEDDDASDEEFVLTVALHTTNHIT